MSAIWGYLDLSNTDPIKKKTYNSIDITKYIMAFAVIAIHTEPFRYCEVDSIKKIATILFTMAVPFFFLASGYLLASKMNYPYDDSDSARVKRQLKKVFKMYIVWTIIYLPLSIFHYISWRTPFLRAFFELFRGFVFVGEQINSWHLWYLLSTVYSLTFIGIFIKRFKKDWHLIAVSVTACLLHSAASYAITHGNVTKTIIENTIVYARIFSGLIYIPIGMILFRRKISPYVNWIMLLAACVARYFTGNEILDLYLTALSSIGLFGIIESLNLKDRHVYLALRMMSTDIYLIHMYVWVFYYKIVYGEKTVGVDNFIMTSIVSALIALINYKIKEYRFLERCIKRTNR